MNGNKGGAFARIGVSALNVLVPGLGLVRLGRGRAALPWLAMPLVAMALPIAMLIVAPSPGPRLAATVFVLTVLGALASVIGSVVATWRASARAPGPRPWWSRWYGVLIVWVAAAIVALSLPPIARHWYRGFYIPSESMMPTLLLQDRLWANMRGGRPPRIGSVILYQLGPDIRVARIAALAGDRIAMRDGVPVVNGRAAEQRPDGRLSLDDPGARVDARRWRERLPGETGTHAVLDIETTPFDDMPEVQVPSGRVFVLGDNRDRAADSRVARDEMGAGMVPVGDLRGVPMLIYWSRDRGRIATTP